MVTAFLVAPLISGLLHAVSVGNLGAGFFALLFAYPVTFLLGVPTILLFIKLRWFRLWQAALVGAGLGLLFSELMFFGMGLPLSNFVSDPASPYFAALFTVHGLAVASLLWFLTLRTHDF